MCLPLHKTIILESSPGFSDNTKYVFDEMILRKINDHYRIYWMIPDYKHFKSHKQKNVHFINPKSIKAKYIRLTAQYIIDSNSYIKKLRKKQFRIHLSHGAQLKLPDAYIKEIGLFDYYTTIGKFFVPICSKIYSTKGKSIVVTGFPRNDGFFNDKHSTLFPNIRRKRTIIWMPTYRNHKNAASTSIHTGITFPYGIPCINSQSDLLRLNTVLEKTHTLLVLKLHPMEKTDNISSLKLSNIRLFNDTILKNGQIQLYDLLKDFDALITDYSSVYYDFLLARKPIGLAIPDLDEFTNNCKLISKNYKDYIKGNYLYGVKDLIDFINNISSGTDPAKKDMEWALNRYHAYQDGNSSKRVVDLLVKEMEKNK